MKKLTEVNNEALANDYKNGKGLDYICKTYKVGKLRAKEIIRSFGIEIRPKSSFTKNRKFVVEDFRIQKYKEIEGYHYVAKAKDSDYITEDYMNNGGYLTSYIKKLGIEIPTLWDRRIYYQETGNYWWEQWFNIVIVKDNDNIKKCPYCNWSTVDIDNKSGMFETHLLKEHNKTVEEYLKDYPNDIEYFKKYKEKKEREERLSDKKNYVICPICGEKFEKLSWTHIKLHGLTVEEFNEKFPDTETISENLINVFREFQKMSNLHKTKNRYISKYEKELQAFLRANNIDFMSNRQILIGKEIDMLIEDKKLGIEFDGLKWHTEWFGKKSKKYHLNKTIECNKNGYSLIHIFEDEYVNHKDIVYAKLSHILGIDTDKPKIMGRKCVVKEIYMYQAKEFLEKYHIQGYTRSSVYLGAFYNDELIAVMTFRLGNLKNPNWELNRFASNYNYVCQGVGGKLFKYFIKNYNPDKIFSFADRRWTINMDDNLYTKIGFKFDSCSRPYFKYFKGRTKGSQKLERIHQISMQKNKLIKKYGFPDTMTETEMAKELGYDRIWDCGLIKYVWEK